MSIRFVAPRSMFALVLCHPGSLIASLSSTGLVLIVRGLLAGSLTTTGYFPQLFRRTLQEHVHGIWSAGSGNVLFTDPLVNLFTVNG